VGQGGSSGVTSHAPRSVGKCEGMNLHTPKGTPIWKSSESNFKGQNPMDLRFPYVIGKSLERRCLKWVHMTYLDTSNTSYGQKKGWESNCHPTTKSRELPRFPCVQVACDIPLEIYRQGP